MSEAAAEHRGWEIESSYHPHYLDDADFEFDGEEEHVGWFWGIAALAVALLIGSSLLEKWLEPPAVKFPAPPAPNVITNFSVPIYMPALPPGWRADCIRADVPNKLVRPNWENPNCKAPPAP